MTVTLLDVTPPGLQLWIEAWDPDKRPVHCSNCKYAKVNGWPSDLRVICAKGHGTHPFASLIRPRNPKGIRDATKCEDFTSMSDEP